MRYSFKLYTKENNKIVFEKENINYNKVLDLIERYWNYPLKDESYYKIEVFKDE